MPESPAATLAVEDGGAPIPQLVQLGEKLGQARRDQGLSLEKLADRLRLGSEQLMALEAGDHTHLPEAVFVVAQAKRVAGALGIDVSQQINDLQKSRLVGVKRRRAPISPLQRRPATATAGQRRSLGWLWGSLLLLGGGGLGVAALQGKVFTPKASQPPSVPTATSNPGVAGGQAVAAGAPSRPEADALVLQSSQPSWLEVRNAAGVTLFRGTFTGEKRFPVGKGLKVLAGRPDLVTATAGSQAPRSLGRIDQVVWRSFRVTPDAP